MKYYHITPTKNLESILKTGLRPSDYGIDGPGLYVWNGPLIDAIREASLSFSDFWYKLLWTEISNKMKECSVLEVEIDEEPLINWGEYSVFAHGTDKVKCIGNFFDISEELSKGA